MDDRTADSSELLTHLQSLVSQLSLERKVTLLTGRDFWSTAVLDEIGLRSMVLSDGPSGVRGERWDERDPSISFPSATSLSSAWDIDLARRYGAHSAGEARRKGIDVILGPTINLHRSPLGGRGFECFSEDPVLTADLAAAYVTGAQERGVAATLKHYVANDSETDRFTASVQVSERALRELYLLAFEKPVREGHAWVIMSAYNSINGVTATEHPLLTDPLNSDWQFDGVVVSDWAAVRTLASASAMQDLVMPGPEGPWGEALVEAVRSGQVDEDTIDRKVLRILLLASRVGALQSVATPTRSPAAELGDPVDFAREAAAEGTVLIRNGAADDGTTLPLHPSRIRKIGLFGQNARFARIQGGGSATVVPAHSVAPLEGLQAALGADRVTYRPGVALDNGLLDIPIDRVVVPGTATRGVLVQLFAEGVEIHQEIRGTGMLTDFDPGAPFESSDRIVVSAELEPGDLSWMRIGFASLGRTVLSIDGVSVLDASLDAEGMELGAAFLNPPVASVALPEGREKVLVHFDHDIRSRPAGSYFSFSVGLEPSADPIALIGEAVAEAKTCDYAVVVVGTSSRVESEGFDRSTLQLPGYQDALVEALAESGTPTIVVVNSGAPVLMPWRERVDAILLTWFGGQEYGHALADVLLGVAEPGGRLPMTWPAEERDVPVLNVTPSGGMLPYDEGIHIGYRAWLASGTTPAYPFGGGTGYTAFTVDAAIADDEAVGDGGVKLRVRVANVGDRAGKHVVQAYASRADTAIERPARWLVGFAAVRLAAGAVDDVVINVPRRAFAHWDESTDAWNYEPGVFEVHIARSAVDDDVTLSVTVDADEKSLRSKKPRIDSVKAGLNLAVV